MILIIDNYDSFTYNLVQYMGETGADIRVVRNDKIEITGIKDLKPTHIVLSPGPGRPESSGICPEIIETFGKTTPILGVCLGHQAIGYVFGGKVVNADKLLHGKTSQIIHDSKTIYNTLENPFRATRYHSLIVEKSSLPDCLEVTAESDDSVIMGIRHKEYPVEGVQFHPESIMTNEGKKLLQNFLTYY